MSKHLNPLEKEFLIRQYRGNQRISINDFCDANHITSQSLRKWMRQYDEGGIELLSRDYDINDLCELMGVSRSGFYKWKKRDPSKRDINREQMIAAVKEVHLKHRTHGYRWTAAFIRINMGISISDNYAYKCFRFLGMRAETTHMVKRKPRKERDKYPNLIYSTWETVDRPRQVIAAMEYPAAQFPPTFWRGRLL